MTNDPIAMNSEAAGEDPIERDRVTELLERRATVQHWLAKLDEQRGTVSEKILARVRADYEARLDETLEALAGHGESIAEELGGVMARLEEAEAERAARADELEEGRLRNLIGETDDASWGAERARIEEELEIAAESVRQLQEEVDRLRDVLERLHFPSGTGSRALPAESAAPHRGAKSTERAGAAGPVRVELAPPSPAPPASPGRPGMPPAATPPNSARPERKPADRDSFLEEIDRALTPQKSEPEATPAGTPRTTPAAEEEPFENTAPRPGLKCRECGYTNDLSAWFCGVCGADVG